MRPIGTEQGKCDFFFISVHCTITRLFTLDVIGELKKCSSFQIINCLKSLLFASMDGMRHEQVITPHTRKWINSGCWLWGKLPLSFQPLDMNICQMKSTNVKRFTNNLLTVAGQSHGIKLYLLLKVYALTRAYTPMNPFTDHKKLL